MTRRKELATLLSDVSRSNFQLTYLRWVGANNVVEVDVGVEMEDLCGGIGIVPRVGEVAVEEHVFVARDETAENESVNTLGLGFRGETGIEDSGGGFDEECYRTGNRGGGPNSRRRNKKKKEESATETQRTLRMSKDHREVQTNAQSI